jgi:hypothetical protein
MSVTFTPKTITEADLAVTRRSDDPATAPLTPSEQRFVGEYLIDHNGTRA